MLRLSILVLFLSSLIWGKPLASTMKVLGRREAPPAGFTLTEPASPDTILKLRIALAQSNPTGLEDALYDVSTPSSSNYGQFLTKEEVSLLHYTPRHHCTNITLVRPRALLHLLPKLKPP